MELSAEAVRKSFETASVARLGTQRSGAPGLVPIVFAYVEGAFWSPIDGKPKDSAALARVRDLAAEPEAALLLDGWHVDWKCLWWIRVEALGDVLAERDQAAAALAEFRAAERALRTKYSQYAETPLFAGDATMLRFVPERITSWAASAASERSIMEGAPHA
jgi:PPOX class probable F420-dependent enzyme